MNLYESVEWALNSPAAIGLISAFAGAFAGALGAQRIAERAKERSDLIRQLRNTNAAITLAHTICNGALALKKQHVLPMISTYREQKTAALSAIERAAKGEGPIVFHLEADLRLFPHPESPIESIKQVLFNSISANGLVLALVAVTDQSLIGLRSAINLRKSLAEELHCLNKSDREFSDRYLGLRTPQGNVNELYPNVIDMIEAHTNEVAFFSARLAEELVAHGTRIQKIINRRFGRRKAQKVFTVDYAKPRELGLIPPDSEYLDWLKGFKQPSTKKNREQPILF